MIRRIVSVPAGFEPMAYIKTVESSGHTVKMTITLCPVPGCDDDQWVAMLESDDLVSPQGWYEEPDEAAAALLDYLPVFVMSLIEDASAAGGVR